MSSFAETTKALIDVAIGRKPADLVIRHGTWVCVQSGEFVPDTDVAIKDGRVAYVGPDASHTITKDTVVLDAENKYLVPGLLDAHMHVESGMLTVTEYVRAVLPHGTTGMFADPHEIANVFGLKGVKLMADEAIRQPIHVWVQVPSCVPSAPGLETSGGEITAEDAAKALAWDGIIGLGEVMNYAGVAAADPKMLAEMDAARRAGKVIGGHYASPDLGPAFHAYAAGGPEDDHEGTRLDDAIARVRQGMKAMIRYSSAWQDVAAQAPAITKLGLDARHFILCSDDCHAETLVGEGHMDRIVRHAIEQGIPPMTAIQMATLNTAEHFGLSREIGCIAPGRWADILIVDDLKDFRVELVIARGQAAAENGKLVIDLPQADYPEWALKSVHLKRPLKAGDFRLAAGDAASVTVNVIGVIENQAPTRHLIFDVQPEGGEIKTDLTLDLAKVAVVERHRGAGGVQVGLVTGFGFGERCAIASTVAHDCHQMIVVGTDEGDMALAVNKLAEIGGGQVVVRKGKIIGLLELPLAGLMSTERADKVAQKAGAILEGFRACGCKINNPNMTLSLLALPVIPELRLSDKGLVDVARFTFIPVVETARN
ncbi:MAG: adenine deaminase [Anaerolineaceae bacterium]|nr:MAG: adenine deaminase [Anaerolineaceae bacterium]